MADAKQPGNEGEGSRTADREYRKGVEEHLRRANVEEEAERAARDLDEHPDELRKAEEEGKRRSAGDLKSDLEK
jgi:chromatin remodeling complex protein RSC6